MNQMLEEVIDDCLSRGNKIIVESALYKGYSNIYISRVKSRSETDSNGGRCAWGETSI